MVALYRVPLGTTARNFFAEEAEQNYKYDEALLVLPSRLLVNHARQESRTQAVNFEYLPNKIVSLNRHLLALPKDSKLEMISRRTQELLVADLLRQLDKLQGLHYFTGLVEKEGFVKAVTGLLGQLSRSGSTQEEITTALMEWEERNPAYVMKDREVAALYNLYRDKLKQRNWYDVEGLYRLAIAVLEKEQVRLPWQHLYFSEFYHFDALQRLLLKALSRHCQISIGLMYEPKRPEIFAAVERSYGYLSGFAELPDWQPQQVGRRPALEHFVVALGAAGKLQADDSDGVLLLEAADKESELRTVVRSIKAQLQAGAAYNDFLVVVRDFNTYSGIRAICDEYGVPVTLPQAASLSAQPVCEFLRLLLTAASGGSDAIAAYWRLLKCGIAKIVWGFNGEMLNGLKQKRFYSQLSKARQDVLEMATPEELADLQQLEQLLESVPKRAAVAEYVGLFQQLLQELDLPRKAGARYIAGRADLYQVKDLTVAVQQLLEVLETLREDYKNGGLETMPLAAAEFCRLLLTACSERQVVLQEADSGGILFGEAANLQGLLFKHVYIMGLREGEFPRSKNENWIYSDGERGYLSSVGVELDNTACAYAEDKFFFAAAAAMATESLTLSWYSDDAAGASAYIEDVERLYLPGTVSRQHIDRKGWQQSLSEQELQLGLAQAEPGHEWLLKRLGNGWTLRSSIEKLRAEGSGIYKGMLLNDELRQAVNMAVGGEFSASNLETYAQCPFRFLLSYVWKQQQYEELTETVEPTVEGNLLHDVLARFLGEHLQEKLTKYPQTELLHQLDDIMTSVCEEYIAKNAIAVTDFWPSQQRRLTLVLHRWLERELAYQKEWEPFVPVKVEWDFGRSGSTPLALAVNGGKIYLSGRIDRIDSNGSGLFVTDYKRSVTPPASELTVGLDLQMPVYLLALAALERQSQVLGGGYYSLKEGKRKGGFALQALGKTPFTANNKPFSEAEDQWLAFADFCRTTVRNYVDMLHEGVYPPAPRKKCPDYCPGKDICREYGSLVTEGGEENV
ncbi:PD-(D/E)XK nuclease family protein [Phascolarctobacterium sp.]|uniref:PD-(D/E)XK nuclease family protein n=1 Tax=Phascolarctobacterium sp. TaxID=2049039 RepID=UPI003077AD13